MQPSAQTVYKAPNDFDIAVKDGFLDLLRPMPTTGRKRSAENFFKPGRESGHPGDRHRVAIRSGHADLMLNVEEIGYCLAQFISWDICLSDQEI